MGGHLFADRHNTVGRTLSGLSRSPSQPVPCRAVPILRTLLRSEV